MERWQNKLAVVTGASSGIGAAIALELINSGLQVVSLARRVEKVEALRAQLDAGKQQRLYNYKCDVTKLDEVSAAFDYIAKKFGGVDVLVNNAGYFKAGQMLTQDLATTNEILQINVMGVVNCTQHAFKSMRKHNNNGHIFVINSVAGHRVVQTPEFGQISNIYAPSKHAVTAAIEVYRQELADLKTDIKITSISPGMTHTPLVPEHFAKKHEGKMLLPEDIARGLIYALSTPPHVQVAELTLQPLHGI